MQSDCPCPFCSSPKRRTAGFNKHEGSCHVRAGKIVDLLLSNVGSVRMGELFSDRDGYLRGRRLA